MIVSRVAGPSLDAGALAVSTRRRAAAALFVATPWPLLGALAAVALTAVALHAASVVSSGVVRVAGVTAGHGALLATALAWADALGNGPGPRARVVAVGLIAFGAVGAALAPVGALAYLALPVWLTALVRQGRLRGLGLSASVPPAGLAFGVLLGVAISTHLLVSATFTLGYRPFAEGIAPVLPGLAYDVGAQIPATELFFRGALFNRAQRRWSFAAACTLATAASIVRYVLDPLLPAAGELVAGAAFYMGLVAIASAWLLWRFGSLVPGLVAAVLVFASYRALTA